VGDLVLHTELRAASGASFLPWAEASGRFRPAEKPRSFEQALAALAQKEQALERLHFLVEASKILNSTLDLFELLEIILKMTSEQTCAERATLFLVDAQRRELWSLIAQGLEQREIRLPIGGGLAGWVAQNGEAVNLADAYADPRFDPSFDSLFGYRTKSILVVPVKDRAGKVVGVLELLNKPCGFVQSDIDFLESISVHAAIALDNARLYRESVERQRLDRELALARTIQQGLLPDAPPRLDGFDLAVRHSTCLYVGGDYYDFLPLGRTAHLFVIADVEGKGAPAALVMSNVQATLRTLVKHVHSLEGIVFNLNDMLRESTRGGRYLTLFAGLLDLKKRGLHYINAGHLSPMLLREDGNVPLSEGGTVIGLFPGQRFSRGFVQLQEGDVVVACTDGITESSNTKDEQYGMDRLVATGRRRRMHAAAEIVDAIFTDVEAFAEGGDHRDDRVVMAIKAL
jgi:sigma-B regulation protein RsbU (phosphoserine phosphatase)